MGSGDDFTKRCGVCQKVFAFGEEDEGVAFGKWWECIARHLAEALHGEEVVFQQRCADRHIIDIGIGKSRAERTREGKLQRIPQIIEVKLSLQDAMQLWFGISKYIDLCDRLEFWICRDFDERNAESILDAAFKTAAGELGRKIEDKKKDSLRDLQRIVRDFEQIPLSMHPRDALEIHRSAISSFLTSLDGFQALGDGVEELEKYRGKIHEFKFEKEVVLKGYPVLLEAAEQEGFEAIATEIQRMIDSYARSQLTSPLDDGDASAVALRVLARREGWGGFSALPKKCYYCGAPLGNETPKTLQGTYWGRKRSLAKPISLAMRRDRLRENHPDDCK